MTHTNRPVPMSFIYPLFCNPRLTVLEVPQKAHLYSVDDQLDIVRNPPKGKEQKSWLYTR